MSARTDARAGGATTRRVTVASAILLGMALASALTAQVPYQRLVDARSEPESWLTYSGSYDAHRYSALDQIDTGNVTDLRVEWVYQTAPGLVESTPVVVDDVMYLTEPPSTVTALDPRTGRRIWRWNANVPDETLNIGFPRVNRGVAILDGTVFVGTLDARLVALDAESGAERWSVVVADNGIGFSMTGAPLAIDGKVIVGVAGAEAGIRGFLDAYDADTGRLLWRTHTVPAPGEPGSETWAGNAWEHGGGSTWLTGSYDPELNLIYWGIGNPAPDWNGDVRPGDNLFTCALIAFDADTGEMRWHFQFTPHDTHDWDATEIPVLVDIEYEGRPRSLVVMANRNAFYYVLDRETGEFLHGQEYSKQTWASGLDENGRPIVIPGTDPTEEGTLVWPSLQGATNWFSPSYSPVTETLYVPVRHMGAIYYKSDAEYQPGRAYLGGGEQALAGDDAWGYVKALDVRTGDIQWEHRLLTPPWNGLMATAGGLVFGASNEGNFFALDAATGASLWDMQAGAPARSNPMSFALDGRQRVVMSAGNAVFVLSLPESAASASGAEVRPELTIPHFAADDERVSTGGFVRLTTRVTVEADGTDHTLMIFAVGDVLTLGAMVQGDFEGTARWEVGDRSFSVPLRRADRGRDDVVVTGLAATGQRGGFDDWDWVNVEVPLRTWAPDGTSIRLEFASDGGRVVLPADGGWFSAVTAER